jgi:GNAT superfamily N-acetyltransferase
VTLRSVVVEPVEPSRTLELRHQVLRPHLSIEEVAAAADNGPDLLTYAAVDTGSGEVLATGNLRLEAPPEGLAAGAPDGAQWRLRGMATREDLRNQGLGALVLDACIEHVAAHGGGLLWCSARLGARRFYARAGFSDWGDEYEIEHIGPHIRMWRRVEPAERGS